MGALRSFLMLLLGLLAVYATGALTVHAATTDDMQIYSGRFDNGWGDSWSWMPRYPTNSPVFTSNVVYVASNSIACFPSGNWQAWWLKAGTSVDTTIYTNLSFWINGGVTGGQTISVQGELNGSNSGLPSVQVTAQANTWKQITISLTSLGVDNKSNLTGFQIGNQTSTQPFFIDDIRLVAAPAPAAVHVNVNANQTVRTVDSKVFSINQVAWDGSVNSAASVSILNNIGATCLRWPRRSLDPRSRFPASACEMQSPPEHEIDPPHHHLPAFARQSANPDGRDRPHADDLDRGVACLVGPGVAAG